MIDPSERWIDSHFSDDAWPDVGAGGDDVPGLEPAGAVVVEPGPVGVCAVGAALHGQARGGVAGVELGVEPLLQLAGVVQQVAAAVLSAQQESSQFPNQCE